MVFIAIVLRSEIAVQRIFVLYSIARIPGREIDLTFVPGAGIAKATYGFAAAEGRVTFVTGVGHFHTDVICAVLCDGFMHDIAISSGRSIHSPCIFEAPRLTVVKTDIAINIGAAVIFA